MMDEPLRRGDRPPSAEPLGPPDWYRPPFATPVDLEHARGNAWAGAAEAPPSRPSRRRRWLIALIAAMLSLAVTGGALLVDLRDTGAPVAVRSESVALQQSDTAAAHSPLAAMIKRVLPSVVNVRVTSVGVGPFGTQEAKGEGSGAIIDKNGIILTNNHVIAGAVRVSVLFNDGRAAMEGRVVGADPQHDLAVVKVDATDLTPIAIGRSSALQLGDQVVAIGFPLDLGGPSVTEGIVSGLNRTIQVQGRSGVERLVGVLQTDAAINPGNSGGPLVDASGQLVGINTAGVQAGAAENIGFAIAIDEAFPIVQQILSKPPEQRAWLGVSAVTVDSAAAAAQLGVPADVRGAAIVAIVPGSPAEDAGIEEGDVIVALNGLDVTSSENLSEVLADLRPGDSVKIDLVNQNGRRTVQAELAQRPAGL